MTTEARKIRVNVNFAESTYQALEELAKKQGKTKAEVLRDVIALAKYIQDAKENGDHILVEREGRMNELVIL